VEQAQHVAAGSIAVGLIVLGLKAAAAAVTGSAALYSDAAESLVNVAAGAIAFVALRLAALPPDANHPYGHEKAEFFSAVIEGVLIVLAALAILREAWGAFTQPEPFSAPLVGVVLNVISTLLNAGWAMFLLRRGRALRSPALAADGRHLMADVVTSGGVLLGVALVLATGLQWIDPFVAALTAAYILLSGGLLIRSSVGGLMDAAPPPDIVERIRAVVAQTAEGAIEAHDLRTRHAGRLTFLEFHLVVPARMTVLEAHDICDRIEAALRAEMEGLRITIHVEPEGKAKHRGVIVL
jgi:cation diffusion facilitator family transporter